MMTGPEKVEYLKHAGRLLLPDVDDLSQVLTYHGEWSRDGAEIIDATDLDGNELSPYCTVDLSQLGQDKHRAIQVTPTELALKRLTRELVTDDDRLSWKIIGHKDSGLALVILQHGYIIGSRWLAYIDPATIPAP